MSCMAAVVWPQTFASLPCRLGARQFHRTSRHCLQQARSATKWASNCTKGESHPTQTRLRHRGFTPCAHMDDIVEYIYIILYIYKPWKRGVYAFGKRVLHAWFCRDGLVSIHVSKSRPRAGGALEMQSTDSRFKCCIEGPAVRWHHNPGSYRDKKNRDDKTNVWIPMFPTVYRGFRWLQRFCLW